MSLLMKVLATVQCAPSILILLPMLPLQNLQTVFSKRFSIFDEVRVELLYTLMEISWTFQVSSAFPSFMSVNFYFGIFTRRAKYLHFEKVSKSKSCDPRIPIVIYPMMSALKKYIYIYLHYLCTYEEVYEEVPSYQDVRSSWHFSHSPPPPPYFSMMNISFQ